MKKALIRITSILLTLCLFAGAFTLYAFAEEASSFEGIDTSVNNIDKSKTATELYGSYTDVTLSVPGKVETLSTDIVFVIDKSSSDKLSSSFANSLFEQLIEVQKTSGATIKIGVVIFNYNGHVALPLTELSEDNYQTLLNSLPKFSGGTNADAGLLLAGQMLKEDTTVADSRKHVIFIGDGLNWAFNDNVGTDELGLPSTILLKADENATSTLYGAGTQSWLSGRDDNGSYLVPDRFESWDEYWNQIKSWVEADKNSHVFNIVNYNGADTSVPVPDYNSEQAVASAVPLTEGWDHALNMDRAIYDTWESYTALQQAGYNCNAYYTGTSTENIGYHLMTMLSGSNSLNFEEIKNNIMYSVASGTKVIDYIGYSDDAVEGYDFNFTDTVDGVEKLPVLKVGDKVYITEKLETATEGATATYTFASEVGATPSFTVDYFYGNGTTTEHFVWEFYESVSRFAPVSLTYTLDLAEKSAYAGVHSADTNTIAVIYPVDTEGDEGEPELFDVPTVEYENVPTPAQLVINGVKLLDGEVAAGFEFALVSAGEILSTAVSDENGSFSFALEFDKEGVYEYTLSEIIGGDENIVYDESIYEITVTVVCEINELVAQVSVTENGESVQTVTFSNLTLTEIEEEDPPLTGDTGITVSFVLIVVSFTALVSLVFSKKKLSVNE